MESHALRFVEGGNRLIVLVLGSILGLCVALVIDFTSFLFSNIKSPYKEIDYVINNNDTVEKILKKYKIRNEDINVITVKLKEKKLSNIYSGRNLSLIIKKLNDGKLLSNSNN